MMQYEREALSNMNEEGGSVEASEYVESAKAPSKALRSLHRRRKYAEGKLGRRWEDALGRAVDGIAGLTAVDGATVITADYELLALASRLSAAKALSRWPGLSSPSLEGGSPEIAEPTQFGGTRQLSAAQFVHDQRDAIALVASQDGRFTVFAWSQSEELVHAHRIDALLHAATFSNQYSCAVHPARLCDALGGPAEGDVDARSEAV